MFKPHYDICKCHGKRRLIVVKSGLCAEDNNKKKNEIKKLQKIINKKDGGLKLLKAKLWEVFSKFIRMRDSNRDYFTCISCGVPQKKSGGNLQAGHYFKSEMYPAIRYDEKNVNGQCRNCNIFKEGNRQGYEKGLIKKYGPEIILLLDIKKNNYCKMGRFEYEVLIKEYESKIPKQ